MKGFPVLAPGGWWDVLRTACGQPSGDWGRGPEELLPAQAPVERPKLSSDPQQELDQVWRPIWSGGSLQKVGVEADSPSET